MCVLRLCCLFFLHCIFSSLIKNSNEEKIVSLLRQTLSHNCHSTFKFSFFFITLKKWDCFDVSEHLPLIGALERKFFCLEMWFFPLHSQIFPLHNAFDFFFSWPWCSHWQHTDRILSFLASAHFYFLFWTQAVLARKLDTWKETGCGYYSCIKHKVKIINELVITKPVVEPTVYSMWPRHNPQGAKHSVPEVAVGECGGFGPGIKVPGRQALRSENGASQYWPLM